MIVRGDVGAVKAATDAGELPRTRSAKSWRFTSLPVLTATWCARCPRSPPDVLTQGGPESSWAGCVALAAGAVERPIAIGGIHVRADAREA